jgi:hypothetical protein
MSKPASTSAAPIPKNGPFRFSANITTAISPSASSTNYGQSTTAQELTYHFERGWFIKNYSRNQIIIDREHFNPAISYSIAKQVFWKKFRSNPVAVSIKDDLIQGTVSLMFMQSGKIKAGANEKYNDRYGF